MITEQLEKARRAYIEGGLPLLSARALRKLGRAAFRSNSAFWFERDLSRPVQVTAPRVDLRVDWNTAETQAWLRQHLDFGPAEERELETARRAGHHYPSVRHEGSIIGAIKVGHGTVYIADFDVEVAFPPGTAFIYDTHVLRAYRGLRVAPFLIASVLRWLQGRGFRRVLCHIPAWNHASRHAYQRCDFSCLRRIWFVEVLGHKWFSCPPELV